VGAVRSADSANRARSQQTWRVLSEQTNDFQTRIEIQRLRLWGCHGALEEERHTPQRFEVDVALALPKVKDDQLSDTVDYRQVIDTIMAINRSHSFQLIEVFAQTIVETLLAQFDVAQAATVSITKYPVFPVGVQLDHVRVEVHVRRDDPSLPTSA